MTDETETASSATSPSFDSLSLSLSLSFLSFFFSLVRSFSFSFFSCFSFFLSFLASSFSLSFSLSFSEPKAVNIVDLFWGVANPLPRVADLNSFEMRGKKETTISRTRRRFSRGHWVIFQTLGFLSLEIFNLLANNLYPLPRYFSFSEKSIDVTVLKQGRRNK